MPSDDFVFGTLGSEALRMAHVRSLNAGVTHRSARSPRDPLPGQPVTLELNLGVIQPYDRAWVYWSVDGQDPHGSAGIAGHGFATPMEPVDTTWDMLEWGYRRRFRAVLPGQPPGTVMRYFLAGWGDFAFANVLVPAPSSMKLATPALYSMANDISVPWGEFAASFVFVAIPTIILFMYLQRYLQSGLTLGGVKG